MKKPINQKNTRIIPIVNERLWEILKNRAKSAFNALKIKYRSWHCCRHSRGTYLHGRTGNCELGMKWLVHISEKVYDKYVHTYKAMMREIKAINEDWGDD